IINNVFDRNINLENTIAGYEEVKSVVPRLESFALASVGEKTKGCMVNGIVPDIENEMTDLSSKVIEGEYLSKSDKGVIIGDGLAKYLNIEVNDTIVLIGQGYHSISAAGKYAVRGIIHLPSLEINNQILYMSLESAQALYSTEDRLTALTILLNRNKDIDEVKEKISTELDSEEYEVMDWGELLFELKQLIDSKRSSSYIMLGLLYMIVGFGVFGTVVMMTAERWREFGLLVSIGMKKVRLMIIVFIETVLLGFLGTLLGFAISLPIIIYFNRNPIKLTGDIAKIYEDMGYEAVMVFSDDIGFMTSQIVIVSVIILICVCYPLLRLVKLKPVKALQR
ncbi:MAG: ABC transporter permease, partial [bacterium]|nr:ABC transporter permease [bacterium]